MKTFLKIAGSVVLLLLLAVVFLSFSHQPEPFPDGSESARRLQPGPWKVGTYSETFVDRDRPTQANGDYPGSDERSLPGDVWFPDSPDAGPAPLVILSHGFTSSRGNSGYLGEHLASHGFVAAAVDYPLTNMTAPGGALVQDVINQPGDVSFLIDTLLGYSAVSGHPLSGKIDAQRIGVAGISLGGLTSTLAGFHPEWRDPRIGAVASIAGPTNFFMPAFFAGTDLPFLMFAGDIDALVPYATNAAPVPDKLPGAELVTVRGGSHTGFSGGAALLRAMSNTDAIGCFSVQRFIKEDDSWEGLLGTPEMGIDYDITNQLCRLDPLPPAINVLRQQMIARVVLAAFFEKTLGASGEAQAAAGEFLARVIAQELDEVSYRTSPAY